MTKGQIIKEFIIKSVIPILFALLLYNMFIAICRSQDGTVNYLNLWILCGIPFGIGMLFLIPINGDFQFTFGIIALNFIIGGLIGGFILVWRLIVAVWYVPLTIIRFIRGY